MLNLHFNEIAPLHCHWCWIYDVYHL